MRGGRSQPLLGLGLQSSAHRLLLPGLRGRLSTCCVSFLLCPVGAVLRGLALLDGYLNLFLGPGCSLLQDLSGRHSLLRGETKDEEGKGGLEFSLHHGRGASIDPPFGLGIELDLPPF